MPRISWFHEKETPIYQNERKLIRVGDSIGILLPIMWARDNGVRIGDQLRVRVESVAHHRKVARARRKLKPAPDPLAEFEVYLNSLPIQSAQPPLLYSKPRSVP